MPLRARSLMLAALTLASSWLQASAAELVVVNTSGERLQHLYISPCGAQNWGNDQLAGYIIESSRRFTVGNIVPGCYDLKVFITPVFSCTIAGERVVSRNVWRITPWTLTQSALHDCSYIAGIPSGGAVPWNPNGFVPTGPRWPY
jgi:hypothetical protein